jgi:outer membrane beta-barrel protein
MKGSIIRICASVLLCGSMPVWAAEPGESDAPPAPAAEQVIQPEIDRRTITIPDINADDVELGLYAGVLSVEDFGSKPVYGLRVAYHLTEDYFVEGVYGMSKVSDEQFRNLLPSGIFPDPEVDLTYYLLSVGYNLLPGEVFFGKDRAYGSGVYLIGGIGNVEFADVSSTTFSFGLGVRLLPTDWVSVRAEMRDHVFEQDVLGENKQTHNFELTLGVSVYF